MQIDTPENQKITVSIPKNLLQDAQNITGAGITKTIRCGLETIARKNAYDNLLKLKGSYKSSIDLSELREDK